MIRSIIRFVAKVTGEIHSPWTRKKICAEDFDALRTMIRPGDIVLSRTTGELTNLLIPGMWKHAAIASLTPGFLIEAVGPGVRVANIFDFAKSKDYLVIIRPFAGDAARRHAAAVAESLVGKSYDFEFESKDQEYYCSELVWASYKRAGVSICPKKPRIFPSDLDVARRIYQSVSFRQKNKVH